MAFALIIFMAAAGVAAVAASLSYLFRWQAARQLIRRKYGLVAGGTGLNRKKLENDKIAE